MNFYELEESLQPRVFILSCNENALVIQTTTEQSKIVLRNHISPDYYVLSSSNTDFTLQFNSNLLTRFSYSNQRAIQISDLNYLKQLEIEPSSNLAQFSSNAQLYYTDGKLQLQFPSSSHTFSVSGNIVSSGTIYASNLQITGDTVILNTVTSNTEQMIITNLGSGPALKVTQEGTNPVAEFYDDTTLALLVADGGSIGIHTSLPLQTLDVRGSQILSGNLGIGTTVPIATLAIGSGAADITSTLMFNSGDDVTNVDKLYWTFLTNGSKIGHSSGWTVNHYAGQEGVSEGVGNGNFRFFTGANPSYNERLTILNDGSVGIGSTQPANRLDVNGSASFNGLVSTNNNNIDTGTGIVSTYHLEFNLDADQSSDQIYFTNYENGSKIGHSNGWNVLHYAGKAGYAESPTNGNFHFFTGGDPDYHERFTILNDGNVGIGSTQPAYRLDVNGNVFISGNLQASNISGTATQVSQSLIRGNYLTGNNYNGSVSTTWDVDATTTATANKLVARDAFGNIYTANVGIGTTSSLYGLHNVNTTGLLGGSKIVIQNGQDGGSSRGIYYWLASDTNWGTYLAQSGASKSLADNTATAGAGFNSWAIRNRTGSLSTTGFIWENNNEQLLASIRASDGLSYFAGNTGIGSSSPAYKLDVAGNAYISGPLIVNDTITATSFSGTATQVSQSLVRGNYLTGNNYNGSVTTTWDVDATSTNTANTVVARDASGNFSAGTITATLSGTATQVSQDLTRGSYLTGTNYNGSVATTWAVDGNSANIPNTVVVRDASGGFSAGVITGTFIGTATQVYQDLIRGSYLTGDNYNGSLTTAWAVDADSANTANKVVVRDASGNFSAGTITAILSGTATRVSQEHVPGAYLTGTNYNGSGTIIWDVDATTISTASKIVARDASSYIYVDGVGIGTTTARSPMDVIGNVLVTGNIGIGTTVAKHPIHVHSSEDIFTVNNGKVAISYGAAITPSTDLEIRNSSDTQYTGILLTNDGNNYPTASLRIEGKRYDQSAAIAYAGSMGLYRYNNNASLNANLPLGLIHFGGNHTSGSTVNRAFSAYVGAISEENFISASNMRTSIVFASGSNAYDYFDTTLTHTNEKMRLNSYGNLGIGTTSPVTTLEVHGNSYFGKGLVGQTNSFQGGPFHKQVGWDTIGTSHTIAYPSYCVANNSSGTLYIQVKSATADKLGNASVSFLKANAANVDLFNIHYHKTANLTTFTIAASTNDITITTDSDCAIAWSSIGSC